MLACAVTCLVLPVALPHGSTGFTYPGINISFCQVPDCLPFRSLCPECLFIVDRSTSRLSDLLAIRRNSELV